MKKLWLLMVLLLLTGCTQVPEETVPETIQTVQTAETEPEDIYVLIDIYAINDLHGRLTDTDQQPGLEELSTFLTQAHLQENALLLSVGDMWQGTAESALTKGAIITKWMNEMDFAAMTLGGHEYDWGETQIRENAQLAEFPFLGINVYSRETNSRVDYCQSSRMVDIQGVQIGIIGAIGDCYGSIASRYTEDVYFKTGSELTELVKAESEKLRKEGADFIVYTLHDGAAQTTSDTAPQAVTGEQLEGYYDVALSQGYVDLVFEADSHYWYLLEDEQGICHLQSGGNNSGLSHAAVMLHKETGEAWVVTTELIPNSRYKFLDKHPIVDALLTEYTQQLAPANRLVGVNERYRSGRDICDRVAQLYCEKGVEKWGADYNIVLGGGYLACRSPGYLESGEVTYGQLQALLPFDNVIQLCSIRGNDLLAKFLETERETYHIATTAYGDSLRQNIDPEGIYYIVTDSYTADYAWNNLTVVDTYDETTFARDLLAADFG